MFERYSLRQWSPTFLQPRAGQCMTILAWPGSTLWRLFFFNSRNEVTSMNHQIRLL